MSNSATEYLPTPSESLPSASGQGSGFNHKSNGAGQGSPRKTPWELREQVAQCLDGPLKKNSFAKLLFVLLTDLAHKPDFKRGEGVIECSKQFLASFFGRSESTIQRAEAALRVTGFLWTKIRWTGAVEITKWFIRDWADDRFEHDAHTGTNTGRRLSGVQRNTVRGTRGKFAPNPNSRRSRFRAWEALQPTVKAEMTVDHGQECGSTTVNDAVRHTAGLPVDNGHPRGMTNRTDDRGRTARMTVDERQGSTLSNGTDDRGPTAPVTGFNTLRETTGEGEGEIRGEEPTPEKDWEKELTVWRQSLNGSFPSRLEKTRTRLQSQRANTRPGPARTFLDRKLSMLNELLDGPMPPQEEPAPAKRTAPPAPAKRPLSPAAKKRHLAALKEAAR